jgi:hypothetical protein
MGFDLASAKPVAASAPPGGGGFDLASAQPVAPKPIAQNFEDVHPNFRAEAVANKKAVDDWRAAGSPQLTTAPKTDAEYQQTRAVLAGLNYEKEHGRPAPEIPVAPKRKATQADIDNAARLAAPDRTYRDDNALGKLFGPADAALGVVGAMATPIIAVPGGFIKSAIYGGDPEKNASDIAERISYRPATGTGAQILRGIGRVAEPLMALPSTQLHALGEAGASARMGLSNVKMLAGANAAQLAAEEAQQVAGAGRLRDLVLKPKESSMGGVGAAATGEETLRVAAANQLPVPMGGLMTKGMRTRAKPDIQFEQIAAKDPELGAGLRNRTVQVNQAALDNFDAFAEATGAQGSGLRPTGKVVNDYLIKRVEKAKTEIRDAYNAAAESVEGKTPADVAPLRAFLEKHAAEAETGNAPVLNAVDRALQKLDPENTGKIPLKEFNEIREMVGRVSKDGTPNSVYRKPLQTLVDDAVETNGGPLYRTARRQYENYQNEFKNAGAIDRLLRAKPGTKDRTVALEDVVTKSTLDAPSTDAVRQVKTTLTRKQDPEGLQAWKEVQGETARQMKERVLGEARLEGGAREILPGKLSKMIREMDADQRLEVLFGKKGAQQWRDLADTVSEMKTIPPGTVSSSGTAEVLAGLLDTAVSGSTGLPLPIASAINYGVKKVRKNMKLKKIDRALNPDGAPTP